MTRLDDSLAQLQSSVVQLCRNVALVDQEDGVGLVQRPHRPEGEVLGVAGPDADDEHPAALGRDPCPTYYPTCVRKTSVYLPDQLKAQLSALAGRSRRSEAELVRAAIEQVVAEGAPGGCGSHRIPPVPGRLVGVGVGPGRADLLTIRALRALHRATVVVAPCTDVGAMGRAEAIVREAAPDVVVERLVFAMTPEREARTAALDRVPRNA